MITIPRKDCNYVRFSGAALCKAAETFLEDVAIPSLVTILPRNSTSFWKKTTLGFLYS